MTGCTGRPPRDSESVLRRTFHKFRDGVAFSCLKDDADRASPEWRLSYYPPGLLQKPHRHEVAQFSTVIAGAHRESTRAGNVDCQRATMVLKPSNFEHANLFGPHGALLVSINIPGARRRYLTACGAWRIADARASLSAWTRLTALICNSPPPAKSACEEVTAELLAMLSHADVPPFKPTPPGWLWRSRKAVETTTLPFAAIAREAGVHRVSLARIFRRYFGVSMSQCRLRARLMPAIHNLIGARASPAEAGLSAGFADQSHFTRLLKRETGVTPGALHALFTE